MILTPNNEKIIVVAREHDPIQPIHAHLMGCGEVDYLQRLMPQMAKAGYLHRVTCDRKRLKDRYACYRYGPEGRRILIQHYGIPPEEIGYTRIPLEDNTRWFNHSFLNTDNSIAIHAALGEEFTYQKVTSFQADNFHKGERVRLTVTPDYSFASYGLVNHLETDTGEEPIYRDNIEYQQSLYRKGLGYLGGLKYGRMKYCVLIVTSSHLRANHIVDTLYPALYTKGGKEFKDCILINYVAALKNDPLHSWCNLAGESASLLPQWV